MVLSDESFETRRKKSREQEEDYAEHGEHNQLALRQRCSESAFHLGYRVLVLFFSSSLNRISFMPLARVERATHGLGNHCSVHLSYRGTQNSIILEIRI